MGAIALFAWSPWQDPPEAEWLASYRGWSDELAASLDGGLVVSRTACEAGFDDEVGESSERLRPVAAAVMRACADTSPAGWRDGRAAVVRALVGVHDDLLPPRRRPDLSAIAGSSVGVTPDVRCWQPDAWLPLLEQYAILRGGHETSLKGIADPAKNRVDLDPGVCEALERYVRRTRVTALSYENFELAEALMVLTHQAEHLKAPAAGEADVECYAVQHVRPLIRAVGWGAEYEREIPLQAWELGYQRLPEGFRSPDCRDGGPLDRHPDSNAWP